VKNPKTVLSDYRRFKQILKITVESGSGILISKINRTGYLPLPGRVKAKAESKPSPQVLRRTLENLGTTFIKLGQLLSERPDILPQEYTQELKKLQDNAEPFPGEKAKRIVEEEIGLERISDFNNTPIATASVAQVHEAKDQQGRDIAIKIRKPGIKRQVEKDLEIIRFIAAQSEKHIQKAKELRASELADEFARWTKQEVNLEKELRNGKEFRKNNEDRSRVTTPRFYDRLSTEKVLVMEKVEGFKVTDREKLEQHDVDVQEMSDTLVSTNLQHYIEDGFFHADPHPSNFLVRPNGDICYLDFGIMGRVTKETRIQMALLLISMINENVEGATRSLEKIGYKTSDYNRRRTKTEVEKRANRIRSSTVKSGITSEIIRMISDLADQGLHIPNKTILMGKSMATMEGIGMEINPEYSLSDRVYQQTKQSIERQVKPKQELSKIVQNLVRNRQSIENIPSDLASNDKDKTRTEVQLERTANPYRTPAALLAVSIIAYATDLPLNEVSVSAAAIIILAYVLSS
jgi:ubiquinone biosynthesis protein